METIEDNLKRPDQRAPDILTAAAVELLKNLRDKEFPHDDPATIEQLAQSIRSAHSYDGYEICRELEQRYHWQPDANMVETFDDAFSAVHQAHKKVVTEWVASAGIKPQRAIGDEVNVTYRGAEFVGEIVQVEEATAQYTIMIPALGHVREGPGTTGAIFKFEDIHELAEPPEEFGLRAPSPRG